MIAKVLRQITRDNLTTVREIAIITGRGESTVYRWMNGDSHPDFMSIRKLANELPDVRARQCLLDHFTHAMPVAVMWSDPQPVGDTVEQGTAACPPVSACIEAVDHIADAMRIMNTTCAKSSESPDQPHQATNLINQGVNALLRSRQLLNVAGRKPTPAASVEPRDGTDTHHRELIGTAPRR